MKILFYFILQFAFATDYSNEGVFINQSDSPMTCFRDVKGCMNVEVILPDEQCKADGIMLKNGKMFKIPNSSTFVCNQTCYADGLKSSMVFRYARHSRGFNKYGEMEFSSFRNLISIPYCFDEDVKSRGNVQQ